MRLPSSFQTNPLSNSVFLPLMWDLSFGAPRGSLVLWTWGGRSAEGGGLWSCQVSSDQGQQPPALRVLVAATRGREKMGCSDCRSPRPLRGQVALPWQPHSDEKRWRCDADTVAAVTCCGSSEPNSASDGERS